MATGLEDLLGDGERHGGTVREEPRMSARHAAAPSGRSGRFPRVLGGALLAVAGVGLGIAALLVLTDGSPAGTGPTVSGPVAVAPSLEAAPEGSTPGSPGTGAEASGSPATGGAATPTAPAGTASPTATSAGQSPAAPSPAAKPAAAPVAVPPMTVLNNSRVSGLGSRAAEKVRAEGFTVSTVGNFTGRIAVSTLYFAPGQDAAAARVAAEVDGIERVLPRFEGLPGSGLTLVVTRDFPA